MCLKICKIYQILNLSIFRSTYSQETHIIFFIPSMHVVLLSQVVHAMMLQVPLRVTFSGFKCLIFFFKKN